MLAARRALIRPKAVLFDLFHTLAYVPVPESVGERAVPDILGISAEEFHRLYYDEDVFGRAVGRVRDSVEAMRLVAHAIDPTVDEDRIIAAVESRRRRFEMGLVKVETGVLHALDRLRALGIRTAIVSDAAVDDLESWPNSPLRPRIDAAIFSYEVGVRKPDRRIYEHALQAVSARPDEALFVGDGGSDEHNGARAVGMGAVLVTRMYGLYRPDQIPGRRAHADWEFEDVSAFVEALPA